MYKFTYEIVDINFVPGGLKQLVVMNWYFPKQVSERILTFSKMFMAVLTAVNLPQQHGGSPERWEFNHSMQNLEWRTPIRENFLFAARLSV
jgi:hypothetical protein